LLQCLERYAATMLGALSQIAGCNRLHSAEQRLCRWLLMVLDRVNAPTLPITHQFMSLMLGTRRASVTEVAHKLSSRALIRYERGIVEVLNTDGLRECSCECYTIIRSLYENAGIL
jgi:CRP-like cAMP-binding protein